MKEARFYFPVEGGVECRLCPHHCRIKEGGRGRCRSRECRDGKLWALSYGAPPAGNLVPFPQLHRLQPFLPLVPEQRYLASRAGGRGLYGVVA